MTLQVPMEIAISATTATVTLFREKDQRDKASASAGGGCSTEASGAGLLNRLAHVTIAIAGRLEGSRSCLKISARFTAHGAV